MSDRGDGDSRPSYDELQRIAAEAWAGAQMAMAARLADRLVQLAAMPDNVQAPPVGTSWSHEAPCPSCTDASRRFFVDRWVTVNGVRHRTTLRCAACSHVDTWDWPSQCWLGSA